MRIAVISDTHIPRAAARLPPACLTELVSADAIVHAGDHSDLDSLEALSALGPPVVAVHGNVDGDEIRRELPQDALFDADGARIAVTHDAGPGQGRARRMARRFPNVDGVIFGHSHIPMHHAPEDGPWVLNPGSPTDRRRQPHHTMAVIHLSDGATSVDFLIVDGPVAVVLSDDAIRGRGLPAEQACQVDLFVTFLGTAASVPTAGRSTSATLISRGGARWLVDCGEGSQRQLLRSGIGLIDLDAIYLTHLHADHYLGLPGLLKSYSLRERSAPLSIYGPPGLERLLRALQPLIGRLSFDVEIEEAAAGLLHEGEACRMEAFPTAHSVPSIGISLVEATRPGAFDVGMASSLGVPEGPLFGRLQRGETITTPAGDRVSPDQVLGEARPSRSVVISGDTAPCEMTRNAARGATVLVHEATFLDEDRERAAETCHTTAAQAAELAAEAGVGLLALTHISSRVSPRDTEQEAAARFDPVVVPRDFEQLEVPYPERGAPVLTDLRARSRRGAASADGAATLPSEQSPQAASPFKTGPVRPERE